MNIIYPKIISLFSDVLKENIVSKHKNSYNKGIME